MHLGGALIGHRMKTIERLERVSCDEVDMLVCGEYSLAEGAGLQRDLHLYWNVIYASVDVDDVLLMNSLTGGCGLFSRFTQMMLSFSL